MKNYRIRLAKKTDAKLLWFWANDSSVRYNSFNNSEIKWNQHLKWFNGKLNSKNTRIWILEIDNKPVGQIRYDRVNLVKAEIDFSIDINFRGNNLGSSLLGLSSDSAFQMLEVETLEGIVQENNYASIKAFLKAGYKKIDDKLIQNRKCIIFHKLKT